MKKTKDGAAIRRQKMSERKLSKVELYVPERIKARLKISEPAMQEGASFRLLPPVNFTKDINSKGLDFMTDVSPWTATSLHDELTASELLDSESVTLKLVEGLKPSIEVHYEDLEQTAVMAVEGEQILISLLICPVADVSNSAEMNATFLKAHKFLPLSTIGIVTVNGNDYYELFGALSSRSLVTSVATEIMALEENYVEVVSALSETSQAA